MAGRWISTALLLVCAACDVPRLADPLPEPDPVPVDTVVPANPGLRHLAAARGLVVGAAVQAELLIESEPYRATLAAQYGAITPANAAKFAVIHPRADAYRFADMDTVVAFAERHGIAVRGHTLVWHRQLPGWVTSQLDPTRPDCGNPTAATRAALRAILKDHITTVVGRYRGRVTAWDVVNEAFGDEASPLRRRTVWSCAIGDTYVDSAFVWARAADPAARLFYNDYGAEGRGAKSDSVHAMARRLRQSGVPIDGVGLQLHGGLETTRAQDFRGPSTSDLGWNMDRLIALGLEVQITEMDVMLRNPNDEMRRAQGRVYTERLGTCLARRRCTAFVTWGFTDLSHWENPAYPLAGGWGEPLPFDRGYGRKPAFDSMMARLRR